MSEQPTFDDGTSTREYTLDDMLAAVAAGVGADTPIPSRLEIRFVGSRDVMVRVYPTEREEPEGYALTV